jgi:hypothetical protein
MRLALGRAADAPAGAASAATTTVPAEKDEGSRQLDVVSTNLLDRQFDAKRPNQKWIADCHHDIIYKIVLSNEPDEIALTRQPFC